MTREATFAPFTIKTARDPTMGEERLEPTIRGPDHASERQDARRAAADYIMKLPKAEQKHEKWQTAVLCLIGAAEGRDFLMHARIGVMQALNKDKPARVHRP